MKLNYKRTIFVGFAFMSICAFWQLYDSIVPLILKQTFAMNDAVSGVIMSLDNVLALFMLPLFGAWSDKVNTRLGRRTPFIIVGTAIAVISMMFMPVGDNLGELYIFVIALGVTLIAMATYRSPAVALMPDVTPKPLRSKGNALINLMGALGGIVALGLISFLVPDEGKPDYRLLFGIIAGFMVVSVIVLLLTVREKKLAAEVAESGGHGEKMTEEELTSGKKSEPLPKPVFKSLLLILFAVALFFMGYNAVTSAFSKYAQVYLGVQGGGFANLLLIATAASVVSYIPIGFLATKIGRKKTIMIGLVIMFLCFAVAATFTKFSYVLIAIFVLTGMGYAAIIVNTFPMVWEMAKGSDVGKYTGYYYTFSMSAQIVTPILSGAMLQYIGYQTLFPYAALFLALSFVVMLFVKHGDSKPIGKKDKLEMLDVGDE